MNQIYFTFLMLIFAIVSNAQKHYGRLIDIEQRNQRINQIVPFDDHHLISIEHICSDNNENYNCSVLFKIEKEGRIHDSIVFPYFSSNFNSLLPTRDSGFIFTGESTDLNERNKFILHKLDKTLSVIDRREYVHPDSNYYFYTQTNSIQYNDQYVLLGTGRDTVTGSSDLDLLLFYVNEDLSLDTAISLDLKGNNVFFGDLSIDHSGLLTMTYKYGTNGDLDSLVIVKFNANKKKSWEWFYTDTHYYRAFPKSIVHSNSNVIMITTPDHAPFSCEFTSVDTMGKILWKLDPPHDFVDFPVSREIYNMIELMNGDILAFGTFSWLKDPPTIPTYLSNVPYMIRLTADGKMLWERAYYKSIDKIELASGVLLGVVELEDGDLLGVGSMKNFTKLDSLGNSGFVHNDLLILSTDLNGCISKNCNIVNEINSLTSASTVSKISKNIQIYPNPSHNQFDLKLSEITNNENLLVIIYDLDGRIIISNQLASSTATIDVSPLPSGTYLVEVKQRNRVIGSQMYVKL